MLPSKALISYHANTNMAVTSYGRGENSVTLKWVLKIVCDDRQKENMHSTIYEIILDCINC